MNEKIIFSSILNENDYLKTLSIFNEPSFSIRVMNALNVGKYALEKSGITLKKTFVPNNLVAAAIYHKVKEIEYFAKYRYKDIYDLVKSINKLRYYIISNEYDEIHSKLPSKIFAKKNDAVIKAYDIIMFTLEENNWIDEVGLIRKAISEASSMDNIEFETYKDFYLRPLEIELLKKVSNNKYKFMEFDNKQFKINSYTKAFGQTNEIEAILSYIYKNSIPFDKCLIATSEITDYSKILINYKDATKFDLTIGGNIKINETNPGRMFSSTIEWLNSHSHKEYLKSLINSLYFDKDLLLADLEIPENFDELNQGLYSHRDQINIDIILEQISNFRFDFNLVKNKEKLEKYKVLIDDLYSRFPNKKEFIRDIRIYPFIERFVSLLDKGIVEFVSRYTKLNDESIKLEEDALKKIITSLNYVEEYNIPLSDIVRVINSIELGSQKSKEGHLHITTISKAISCLRPYVFIVGLSSNNFPGKAVEDPYIMNQDYSKFGLDEASKLNINNNKSNYFALLNAANKYGCEIHLSYNYYNSETLKSQSASSVIFETYKKEYGEDKTLADLNKEFPSDKFKVVSYFQNNILPSNIIGRIYNENKTIKLPEEKERAPRVTEVKTPINTAKAYSASAIKTYAECEYSFFLQYVLGLEQPPQINIYQIIDAVSLGTLAHSLLERLDKSKVTSKELFMEIARKAFDQFLISHPTDNFSQVSKEKEEFANMMGNAYEMDENEKTLFKEEDVKCEHRESGILIHGFPDKVIGLSNGHYKVIDYKTGRNISHDPEDPTSMIQGTIYSYILKHTKNVEVDGFEFRYIRQKHSVYSKDMNDYYNNLTEILKRLKTSLETGVFNPASKSVCSDCYWKDICNKRKA